MKLKGKTVVVTGGGNGMGRELCLELVRRGAKAAAIDISEEGLAETKRLAGDGGDRIATFVVNITDREAVEALPAKVEEALGPADGLINCAGIIQPFVRLADLDYDVIDRVMAVNFRGTLYMTKAFLPGFLARPEAHVANVASMGGFLPVPGQTLYGASKAAVKLMTEGLAAELKDTKVGVTVIFPGAIGTDIAKHSGVTMKNAPPPEEAARQTYPPDAAARDMLDAIERNAFRALVGRDAKFLDGFYRLAPKRAAMFIADKMDDLLAD